MTTVRIPEDVLLRSFGNEMVLLNLRTGQYHGLNETGGRILEVLAEVGDTQDAAARIAAEYGRSLDEVSRDVDELCAALAERSLVKLGGAGQLSQP
jgi:hypothetical protein